MKGDRQKDKREDNCKRNKEERKKSIRGRTDKKETPKGHNKKKYKIKINEKKRARKRAHFTEDPRPRDA